MRRFAALANGRSPLNDLLEKEDFTLEQVLEEDELIQEVKTRNTKLLELYVCCIAIYLDI